MTAPRREDGPGPRSPDARCLDAAIDELLDGSVEGEARRALLGTVRGDDTARRELMARASAVMMFRESVEAPDLSGAILHDVDRRRPFLSGRLRGLVTGSRLAVAGAGVAAVLAVALIVRANPSAFRVGATEAPLTRVSDALRTESAETGEAAAARLEEANSSLFRFPTDDAGPDLASGSEPVAGAGPSGEPGFAVPVRHPAVAPGSSARPVLCPVMAGGEPGSAAPADADAPLP